MAARRRPRAQRFHYSGLGAKKLLQQLQNPGSQGSDQFEDPGEFFKVPSRWSNSTSSPSRAAASKRASSTPSKATKQRGASKSPRRSAVSNKGTPTRAAAAPARTSSARSPAPGSSKKPRGRKASTASAASKLDTPLALSEPEPASEPERGSDTRQRAGRGGSATSSHGSVTTASDADVPVAAVESDDTDAEQPPAPTRFDHADDDDVVGENARVAEAGSPSGYSDDDGRIDAGGRGSSSVLREDSDDDVAEAGASTDTEADEAPAPVPSSTAKPGAKKRGRPAGSASAASTASKKKVIKTSSSSSSSTAAGGKRGRKRARDTAAGDVDDDDHMDDEVPRRQRISEIVRESDPATPGVRRTGRVRMRPLEYWRNETVVYERRDEALPEPVEVIRPPATPVGKRGGSGGDGGGGGGGKRARVSGSSKQPNPVASTLAYVDADGKERMGEVAVSDQLLMYTDYDKDAHRTNESDKAAFSIAQAFRQEHWRSGLIVLLPGEMKPSQNTNHMALVCCVVAGTVELLIEDQSVRLPTAAQFWVPPHNMYSLRNLTKKPAKVSFVAVTPD